MKRIIASFIILISSSTGFAQWNYPASKTVNASDTYWGVTYKDPYRWLENIKEPVVTNWFKQQADLTNSIMNKVSGRNELIEEWKKLDKLQPPSYRFPFIRNGKVFIQKTMPGERVSKVYYRQSINAKDKLLFDPLSYIPGKTLTVEEILPSYDGKKLIITYSEKGAEFSTIRIMNVDSKQFLKDSIYPSNNVTSWNFDDNSFLYNWLRTADNNDPEGLLNLKTKLHILGTDVKTDVDIFSNESSPSLKMDPSVHPIASLKKDSRNYIFSEEGTVQREMKMYYAPIAQLNSGKIQWKVLCTPANKIVRSIRFIGDKVFAITYDGAKNYKLISTDLKNPDWANAKTIAAEKTQTIESFNYSKDFLLIKYSDGINDHLYKYNLQNEKTSEIKLPFPGTAYIVCLDTETNDCLVGITSWNKPFTEYMYDAATDKFSPSIFSKPLNYPAEYQNLVAEETEVKGYDGAMIPLTIIYKKGLKKDGSNVCLMDSYGAYGHSLFPNFDVQRISLAVRGVVIAIPHVRGGSEKGQEWYMAGFKTTKPNTWKDFISCAEFLIAKGYTSSNKLAGSGMSAGGILISRAITERPDLFAAAICNVGTANTMRLEFSSNGPANTPEFGSVKDSIETKGLYEMDGLQHVVEGTKYPAVICVGGWHDSRVPVWEPGKFAAALQNASASGKPVLMKVNYDNGHFTEDKNVTYANFADQYAFVLWQCGHPDFKLKK
ncbi:MAG: prolyl oligopeptidase family serine peptidase [Ferruginibacter sp.]